MANARRFHAQSLVCNSVSIGGLSVINVSRGYGNVAVGQLDGIAGGTHGTAKGDKFVTGNITHEDVEQAVALINGTVGTGVFFEKESATATWTQRTLNKPVIGDTSIVVRAGAVGQVNHAIQCTFDDGEDFEDVDTGLAAQTEPTVTIQRVFSDPITCTFDTGGAPIVVPNFVGLSVNIVGDYLFGSDPGNAGRTAVHWIPRDVTFQIEFMDGTLSTGPPATDLLMKLQQAAISKQIRTIVQTAKGDAANWNIDLENVVFLDGGANVGARALSTFIISGRCDWIGAAAAHYKLTGANLIVAIAAA